MKKFWSLAIIGATLTCGLAACSNTSSGDVTSPTVPVDTGSTSSADSTNTSSGDSTTTSVTPAEYKLDFTTLDENSTVENAFSADWLTLGEYTNVYSNAGTGGCHQKEYGLVKMGTAKAEGVVNFTTVEKFTQCKVVTHDFYALSDTYPTNSNSLAINGDSKLSPYNAEGQGEEVVYTFEGTDNFTFTSNKRVYIWSIEFIK